MAFRWAEVRMGYTGSRLRLLSSCWERLWSAWSSSWIFCQVDSRTLPVWEKVCTVNGLVINVCCVLYWTCLFTGLRVNPFNFVSYGALHTQIMYYSNYSHQISEFSNWGTVICVVYNKLWYPLPATLRKRSQYRHLIMTRVPKAAMYMYNTNVYLRLYRYNHYVYMYNMSYTVEILVQK